MSSAHGGFVSKGLIYLTNVVNTICVSSLFGQTGHWKVGLSDITGVNKSVQWNEFCLSGLDTWLGTFHTSKILQAEHLQLRVDESGHKRPGVELRITVTRSKPFLFPAESLLFNIGLP